MAGQVPADAVHADERGVPEQVDQRVGHLHRPAPVPDLAYPDPGLDDDGVVGVQRDRQPGVVQLRGHRHRQLGGADHADGLRDAGAECGHHIGGDLGPVDRNLVPGTGDETGRRRPTAHCHEHVHSSERTAGPAFRPTAGSGGGSGGDANGVTLDGLALNTALLGSDAVVLPANGWSCASAHGSEGSGWRPRPSRSGRQGLQAGDRLLEDLEAFAKGETDQMTARFLVVVEDRVGHGHHPAAVRKGPAEGHAVDVAGR